MDALCLRCAVRNANDRYYTLTFLDPSVMSDSRSADSLMQQSESMKCTERLRQRSCKSKPNGYFSITRAVDGVADLLSISDDDEWEIGSLVVEVKNRVDEILDPPPLHDKIQTAVYMKMLNVTEGDLEQFMNDEEIKISISRISLVSVSDGSDINSAEDLTADFWSNVVLPRLYQFTNAIVRARGNEMLRLEYLAGSASERLAFLRRECDFFVENHDPQTP